MLTSRAALQITFLHHVSGFSKLSLSYTMYRLDSQFCICKMVNNTMEFLLVNSNPLLWTATPRCCWSVYTRLVLIHSRGCPRLKCCFHEKMNWYSQLLLRSSPSFKDSGFRSSATYRGSPLTRIVLTRFHIIMQQCSVSKLGNPRGFFAK